MLGGVHGVPLYAARGDVLGYGCGLCSETFFLSLHDDRDLEVEIFRTYILQRWGVRRLFADFLLHLSKALFHLLQTRTIDHSRRLMRLSEGAFHILLELFAVVDAVFQFAMALHHSSRYGGYGRKVNQRIAEVLLNAEDIDHRRLCPLVPAPADHTMGRKRGKECQ